jgi:asparagine synthase (glutamine-hydrolysing)
MCGFAGALRLSENHAIDFERLAVTMGQTLPHRGPDEETSYAQPGLGVAFRRLSIIDVEGGSQPQFNEDQSIACFLNGEILNYVELREEIGKSGRRLRTDHSDTEVIPHLYEMHGDAFVDRLVGMFSIVLWDAKRERLLLIRDRFGIKPLFYADTGKVLLFASEIKAILASGLVPRQPDPVALQMLMHGNFVFPPRTTIAGVRCVRPSRMLIAEKGNSERWKVREHRYYDLRDKRDALRRDGLPQGKDLHAYVYDRIDEVMAMWMRSDVPIGVSQSGGIDSSILMHHAARHADRVVSITVDLESERYFPDEVRFATLMARRVDAHHHVIKVGTSRVLDSLPNAVWVADNLNLLTPAMNHYLVAAEASKYVKVLLNGSGGDELFVGYPWYDFNGVERLFFSMPRPVRKAALAMMAPLGKAGGKRRVVHEWLSAWHGFPERYARKHIFRNRLMYPWEVAALFRSDYDGRELEEGYGEYLTEFFDGDVVNALGYLDLYSTVAANQTNQTDYAGMAHSIETRPPFLDHRLAELMLSVPSSDKIGPQGAKKHLLKAAYQGHIPDEILHGRKVGFASPMHLWIDDRFKRVARSILVDRRLPCLAGCDADRIRQYVDLCDTNWKYAEYVYGLLAYATWHRLHIDLGQTTMPNATTEELWS